MSKVGKYSVRTITTVARRLNARNAPKSKPWLPMLLAMTDTQRCPDPSSVLHLFPAQAGVVFRNGDDLHRLRRGQKLKTRCDAHGILFICAGNARDALKLCADGLHVRDQNGTRAQNIRQWKRRNPNGIVFAAAHNPRSLRACEALDVDGVLLSPIFPTKTHPKAKHIGITRFRQWVRKTRVPVYALGGITPSTAPLLITTQCIGIAGIDWVLTLIK